MSGFEHALSEKEELLDEIRASRARLESILEQLSDEQMTETTDEGGWSIKDHLAHIAAWQRHGLALMTAQPPQEAFGVDEETYDHRDMHEINDIVFKANRERPLEDVLHDFRQTHREALTTIGRIDDSQLEREIDHVGFTTLSRTMMEIARGHFVDHEGNHLDDIAMLANQPR